MLYQIQYAEAQNYLLKSIIVTLVYYTHTYTQLTEDNIKKEITNNSKNNSDEKDERGALSQTLGSSFVRSVL